MATKSGVSVAPTTSVASASFGAFADESGSPWIGAAPASSAKSNVANGAVKGDTASTSSNTAIVREAVEQRSRVNDTNIFIFGYASSTFKINASAGTAGRGANSLNVSPESGALRHRRRRPAQAV